MKLKTSLFGAKCYLFIKEQDRLRDWMALRSHSEGLRESAIFSCPQLVLRDIDAKGTENRLKHQVETSQDEFSITPILLKIRWGLGFLCFLSEALGISNSQMCTTGLNEHNAVWHVTCSNELSIFFKIKLGLAHRESMSVIKLQLPRGKTGERISKV